MTKSLKIISAIFLLFFSSAPLIYAADPPLKDLFYTQAQEALNSPPVYGVQENVDPFSGYLTLLHTDVSIPGNGGLDIKIMRRYNSAVWSRRDVPYVLAADKELSPLGLGWSMHMGIVRNAYGSSLDGCFAINNPVVEMPDGSQHVMYNVPNTANTFISKEYWIYKVLPNGIFELTLTDGTVYTFAHSPFTAQGYAGYTAYGTEVAQVTSIRNAAGTASLQITYDKQTYALVGGYSVLKTITDNFNRVITFNYAMSSLNTPQLTSITNNYNKTLIGYKYETLTASTGFGTYNTLTRAYLPIPGEYETIGNWSYSYNSSNYQLQTITYPTGGSITYTHSDVMFHTGTWPGVTFSVVTKKVTGGRGITAGTWDYAYSTGGTSGNITTITAPDNIREVHTFKGWGNSASGSVWQIGLPTSKMIYSGASLTYSEISTWLPSAAISDNMIRNPSWYEVGGIIDQHIYAPLLISKSVTRDTKTYTTSYGNYDLYGNATSVSEIGDISRTTTVDYWTNAEKNIVRNKPLTVTVSGGNPVSSFATTYSYDANSGNNTSINRYGVTTDFTYDGSGNLDTVTDDNNHKTYFDWSNGRISQRQNPEYTVKRSINSDGTIASETNGRDHTTVYTYDANLRLKTIDPPVGNTTNITYALDNSYKRVQRSGSGYYLDSKVDGFGRSSGTSDSIGIVADVAYWAYGPKKTASSNVGDTVNYDVFERVDTIVHKDTKYIDYAYSGSNVTVTDEDGKNTVYTYNAFGNPDEKLLISVKDALLNTTSYTYNILGSLTSIIQPGIASRSFTYDTKNFLVGETHPDRGAVTYTRDNVGNMATKYDSLGTTAYTYDGINRLTCISINGSCKISFGYDDADNRISMNNASATISYGYDEVNNITSKTETVNGRTYTTQYGYDLNDNLTDIDYPSGRHAEYAYNSNNQVTTVSGFGGSITNVQYYTTGAIGLPYRYTYSNGHTTTLTYNTRNLTTGIAAGSAIGMAYTYDVSGNTTSMTNSVNPSFNQAFTYDSLNRLSTINGSWGGYTYDALGNRKTKVFGGTTTDYGYTSNRLTSVTSGGSVASHTYNNDGDLQAIESYSFTYDEFHRVLNYKLGSTLLAEYSYDGDGMRISKTESSKTTIYHYDQSGRVLSENDKDKNLLADYVYLHGKLVAKIAPSKPATPENLKTWVAYTNRIDLYWTDKADNELGYIIERKLTSGGTYTVIGQVGANVATYSDYDPTKITGSSYTYRVVAFNQIGNSDSYTNEASGMPTSNPLAVMTVSPASMTFGDVLKDSSSASTTVTVTNLGSGDLIITNTTGTTNFTVSAGTCSNATLTPKPNSTCTFTVSFAPTSGGLKNANVTLDTNLPDLLVPVSGNATLKLTVNNINDHKSSGTIASSPAGIYCAPTCTSTFNTYNLNSAVTLTATPSTNSFFAGWSGSCSGTGNCPVTMNDHKTVSALFKISPPVAAFSASTTTVGVIPPTPITFTDQSLRAESLTWNFGDGTIVTDLTPTANPTRSYSHAYASLSSTGTYTVSLLVTNTSGTSLVTRTITVQPCSDLPARINRGSGATLINYPTLGDAYRAAINNDVIEALAINFQENLNVDRDVSISINGGYLCGYATKTGISTLQGMMTTSAGAVTIGDFEIVSSATGSVFDIAAYASIGGSISPAGTLTLVSGASVTFNMTPDPGYQLLDVLVDGGSVGAVNPYTFSNITKNHTIKAVF